MRCRVKNDRDEEGVIDEDRSVVGRSFVTDETIITCKEYNQTCM